MDKWKEKEIFHIIRKQVSPDDLTQLNIGQPRIFKIYHRYLLKLEKISVITFKISIYNHRARLLQSIPCSLNHIRRRPRTSR